MEVSAQINKIHTCKYRQFIVGFNVSMRIVENLISLENDQNDQGPTQGISYCRIHF